jgi:hypothetical protein
MAFTLLWFMLVQCTAENRCNYFHLQVFLQREVLLFQSQDISCLMLGILHLYFFCCLTWIQYRKLNGWAPSITALCCVSSYVLNRIGAWSITTHTFTFPSVYKLASLTSNFFIICRCKLTFAIKEYVTCDSCSIWAQHT